MEADTDPDEEFGISSRYSLAAGDTTAYSWGSRVDHSRSAQH